MIVRPTQKDIENRKSKPINGRPGLDGENGSIKNVRGSGVITVADNITDDTVDISITEDSTHRFVTDTEKGTWNDKSNLILGDLITDAYYGDKGKIGYDHSQTTHAPSNAQKNSDITKDEIEAKLTGEISSHTHASSGGLTQEQIEGLI